MLRSQVAYLQNLYCSASTNFQVLSQHRWIYKIYS
jgi:hypothetical protein